MELWLHQRECLDRARELPFFGLLFDPGLGKTLCVIKILEEKFEKFGAKRTLILTPSVVVHTWHREFQKYSSIDPRLIHPLTGPVQKRTDKYLATPGPHIFITNYEALYSAKFFSALMSHRADALVLDEAHRVKDPSAQRTKRCVQLGDLAGLRYILTGTLVLNSAMDVFMPFRFLLGEKKCSELLAKNHFMFRAKYFFDKNAAWKGSHKYFPNWVMTSTAPGTIKGKIAPYSMSVKKEDALDLPPLIRQSLFVELSKDQKKIYDEMKKDFISFVNDKAVTAQIALTKVLRLQQILSGFVQFEDGTSGTFKDCPRRDALHESLSELTPNHKVIVWAVFYKNYETIRSVCEELKLSWAELHGETKDKDGEIQRFNNDPTVRVLIAHPGAGGIGISLIPSSYSIWYSRNFSLEQEIQATARNYRGGSEIHEKVTRIDIIAKDTVDEAIVDALRKKAEMSNEIVNFTPDEQIKIIKEAIINDGRNETAN